MDPPVHTLPCHFRSYSIDITIFFRCHLLCVQLAHSWTWCSPTIVDQILITQPRLSCVFLLETGYLTMVLISSTILALGRMDGLESCGQVICSCLLEEGEHWTFHVLTVRTMTNTDSLESCPLPHIKLCLWF